MSKASYSTFLFHPCYKATMVERSGFEQRMGKFSLTVPLCCIKGICIYNAYQKSIRYFGEFKWPLALLPIKYLILKIKYILNMLYMKVIHNVHFAHEKLKHVAYVTYRQLFNSERILKPAQQFLMNRIHAKIQKCKSFLFTLLSTDIDIDVFIFSFLLNCNAISIC